MRRAGITLAVVALVFLSGCEAALFETEKGRHDIEVRNDDTSSDRVNRDGSVTGEVTVRGTVEPRVDGLRRA